MVPRIFRWPWMSLTLGYAFLGGWRGLLSPSRSVGCWPLRSPVFSNTAMFEEAARELRIPRDPATCSGEDRNTYSPWSQHGSGVHPLFVEDFMVFLTGPCHPLPWNVSQSIFFFEHQQFQTGNGASSVGSGRDFGSPLWNWLSSEFRVNRSHLPHFSDSKPVLPAEMPG